MTQNEKSVEQEINVQRFSPYVDDHGEACMDVTAKGDYVRVENYLAALLSEREKVKRLLELLKEINSCNHVDVRKGNEEEAEEHFVVLIPVKINQEVKKAIHSHVTEEG